MKYHIVLFEQEKIRRHLREASAEYMKRLSRYCRLDVSAVKKEKDWVKRWEQSSGRVLLVPGDRSMSSEAFSDRIASWEMSGQGSITFFIPGGLYQNGLHACRFDEEKDELMHLSSFTMDSGLTGVVLLEQIYRGYRILHHHPYHK